MTPTRGSTTCEACRRTASLGYDEVEYRPYAPVLRRQMASFIDLVQDAVAEQLGADAAYEAANAAVVFDVPGSHAQAEDIYSLQSVGIVQGTWSTRFSPDAPVTRGQMALFLTRHLDENVDAERASRIPEDVLVPRITSSPPGAGAVRALFQADRADLREESVTIEDFTHSAAAPRRRRERDDHGVLRRAPRRRRDRDPEGAVDREHRRVRRTDRGRHGHRRPDAVGRDTRVPRRSRKHRRALRTGPEGPSVTGSGGRI